ERYNGNSFKTAKALRTKLMNMQILQEWENVFASETDFLSPQMVDKHDRALLCMNSIGTMIESNLPGQSPEHQGLLLMELCKFVVSARVYPWLLTRGPDSKEMQDLEVKLFTAIAGAPFVSKLGQKRGPDPKPSKVKAAVIEEEPEKKAKGKAKSKAKAKAGKRKAQGDDDMAEPSTALQGPVEFEEGTRPRRWLDDLLGALITANYGKPLMYPWNSPAGQLTRMLISYGLEFALTGSLTLNKKIFKDWSKAASNIIYVVIMSCMNRTGLTHDSWLAFTVGLFECLLIRVQFVRPHLQSLMRALIKKTRDSVAASSAASTAADSMVSHLFDRVSEEKAALENQTAEAGSEEDVSDVKAWVRFVLHTCKMTVEDAGVFLSKNTGPIESHPAFRRFRGILKDVTCTCSADADAAPGPCSFHDESEHSIQDLVWGVTECLRADEESVPTSVLRVGLATLGAVAIHASGSGAKPDEKVQTPAELVGKHAKFVLIENERGEFVFNEQAIEGMIVCRALYMLLALRQVIEKPLEPRVFVTVSDVPSLHAFASLLDFLLSKDGKAYVMEVESRCHFAQNAQGHKASSKSGADADPGSGPVSLWCSTWSKILFEAVRAHAKSCGRNREADAGDAVPGAEQPEAKRAKTQMTKIGKDLKGPEEYQIQPPADPKLWASFLPSPTKLFSKSLADSFLMNTLTTPTTTSAGPATGHEAEAVKEEATAASASAAAQPQAAEPTQQVELLNKTPTITSIYNMHNLAGVKSLNVLDVLAIGQQVQTHMLQRQGSNSTLLGLLQVDLKSQLVIDVIQASNALSGEGDHDSDGEHVLYMHGHVTPEQTAKCVKVAEATFDDGPVSYYMQGDNFNKTTSAAPNAIWMMKTGYAQDKALFAAQSKEVILEFPDACGTESHRAAHSRISASTCQSQNITFNITHGNVFWLRHGCKRSVILTEHSAKLQMKACGMQFRFAVGVCWMLA
ncbi:unnamed protein product, partial [Symbiodinium sp. CCMP2456]